MNQSKVCCQYVLCDRTKLGHIKFTLYRNRIKYLNAVKNWFYQLGALDYKKISNIEVDGIDTHDYPDFCDAFISYAEYKDKPMTEAQLERLNRDSDFVYDQIINKLY